MRRNFIDKGVALFFLTALLIGCQQKKSSDTAGTVHAQHADVPMDSSLQALLKPANERVVADIPVIHADTSAQVFTVEIPGSVTYDARNNTSLSSRVGGRIERLFVKYNYQPVRRGQLIMEIYSPDLVSAQRELLLLRQGSGSDSSLYDKAVSKLRFLGLTQRQINGILKTGQPDYSVPIYSPADGYILEKAAAPAPATPAPAETGADAGMGGMGGGNGMNASSGTGSSSNSAAPSPIMLREGQYVTAGQGLFTIYTNNALIAEFSVSPDIAPFVKTGMAISYQSAGDPANSYTGTIGLIEPTYRAGENFTSIRVYGATTALQVGELLTGKISVGMPEGWWVPKQAVVKLGNRSVVFKKQEGVFVPMEVQSGAAANGMIQILDDISSWSIAANAHYLVDSESFIIPQNDN